MKVLLLVASVVLTLATSNAFSEIEEPYRFFDEQGNQIVMPANLDIQPTENAPLALKAEAERHTPKARFYFREVGLQDIRIVDLSYPHPMQHKEDGTIETIYILDKDGLLVGFKDFSPLDQSATAKIRINGVINYIQIVVVCSKHGSWKTSFHIR